MTTIELPNMKTDRLLLRQFVDNDIENVFKGLSDPNVIKYYGISFDSLEGTKEQMTWSLEGTKEQMTWFANLEKNETGIWWAICSLDNKIFYGAGGLNCLSKKHKKAEIGFWLLTDFWGQEIMREAMPLICKFGFDKLRLHRIEGFVESDNKNCKLAMSKLDFRHEVKRT